jgi:hypothetical protein
MQNKLIMFVCLLLLLTGCPAKVPDAPKTDTATQPEAKPDAGTPDAAPAPAKADAGTAKPEKKEKPAKAPEKK